MSLGEDVPMKERRKRCSRNGWCWAMEHRLNDENNSHMKGLSVLVLMDMKTGKDLPPWGIFFRKDAKDKGLLLNVCPWCTRPIFFGKKGKKK